MIDPAELDLADPGDVLGPMQKALGREAVLESDDLKVGAVPRGFNRFELADALLVSPKR
jgi:hypothetical protein